MSELAYSHFHLNAPVPDLETDESYHHYDDADSFLTNEMDDDSSIEQDEEISQQHDDDDEDEVPAKVSYESDDEIDGSEIEEEEDSSTAASSEMSEEGFDESDYESVCTIEDEQEPHASFSTRHDHDLFLPHGLAPTFENLKCDQDSSEDYCHPPSHATYRSRRPLRMMMLPQKQLYQHHQPSNISDDSEDDSIHQSTQSHPNKGVSFDETVTVHPIYETDVYTPQMLDRMYTKREEIRINKLRNKREYAYDNNDWENATEENEMEVDDETGEYVHPVHRVKRTWTRGPFLSNVGGASSIWNGGVKAKRMRMYYP